MPGQLDPVRPCPASFPGGGGRKRGLSSRTRPSRNSAPLARHPTIAVPVPSPPGLGAPLPPRPSDVATPERVTTTGLASRPAEPNYNSRQTARVGGACANHGGGLHGKGAGWPQVSLQKPLDVPVRSSQKALWAPEDWRQGTQVSPRIAPLYVPRTAHVLHAGPDVAVPTLQPSPGIFRGREKMSKRKTRTSGTSDSEDKIGSTVQSGEEPRPAAPSIPDGATEGPSRLLGQPEKDPAPFPLSQNSVGKFVPQFAKPQKTVTRKTKKKEEDNESGTFNLELLQEPSAPEAGSQPLRGSLGLALLENQAKAAVVHPEQCSQLPLVPVPCSGTSVHLTSSDNSPSRGTVPSTPERASQEQLSESGTCVLNSGNSALESSLLVESQRNSRPGTEQGLAEGGPGQNGPLSSECEDKELHRGGPPEEGEGDPSTPGSGPAPTPAPELSPVSLFPEPRSATQGCPNQPQVPIPNEPVVVIADRCTGPTAPPVRDPEVAKLDRQGPDGSGALPHSSEAAGGHIEAGLEAEPRSHTPELLATSPAPHHENQEPTVGAGNSSPLAPEVRIGVDLKPLPDLTQEGPEYTCALLSVEPVGGKAAEPGIESLRDPEPPGHGQSLQAASLPDHREVDGLSQEPGAHTAPSPAHQAIWGCSSPIDLDFLPDSQIQNALDAPDLEAPPEQVKDSSPLGSIRRLCCPGTSPPASGASVTSGQPRNPKSQIQAFETPELEDATGTVCGLVMELSNLNRLIMSAHRDLEALRRLGNRKGKPTGKGPAPYASKGAGTLPRGEPWRDG
ncbi:PREDICTED: uncharacterized protein C19orf57 homolog [Elephantulus edwardii]|uniref:uncharacterized protein C19orf57 homolog n=1 Tax=Elephantulus edwardii TaxID=28737 RepID=UPI0003F08755|nr:PREDICTED: uncharacterized protein C19orf57 homolog [Elephantulus edwardii]